MRYGALLVVWAGVGGCWRGTGPCGVSCRRGGAPLISRSVRASVLCMRVLQLVSNRMGYILASLAVTMLLAVALSGSDEGSGLAVKSAKFTKAKAQTQSLQHMTKVSLCTCLCLPRVIACSGLPLVSCKKFPCSSVSPSQLPFKWADGLGMSNGGMAWECSSCCLPARTERALAKSLTGTIVLARVGARGLTLREKRCGSESRFGFTSRPWCAGKWLAEAGF